MAYRTNRPLDLRYCGSSITPPAGTQALRIKGADGLRGDLFAAAQAKVLIDLTGNTHDPKYRYCWLSSDAIAGDTEAERETVSAMQAKEA